jgi:hypothetical protein
MRAASAGRQGKKFLQNKEETEIFLDIQALRAYDFTTADMFSPILVQGGRLP